VSQGWLVCEYPMTEVMKRLLVRLVVMGSGHVEEACAWCLFARENKNENLEALHYRSSFKGWVCYKCSLAAEFIRHTKTTIEWT
jgi:hypothetical protein